MKRQFQCLVVAVVIGVMVSLASAQTNLLTNSSFESWTDGNPEGWTKESSVTISQESGTVHSGSYSIGLQPTSDNNRGIYQDVSISDAQTYNLSVWLYAADAGSDIGIFVSWYQGTTFLSGITTSYPSQAGQWEEVTQLDLTPPSGADKARIKIRGVS